MYVRPIVTRPGISESKIIDIHGQFTTRAYELVAADRAELLSGIPVMWHVAMCTKMYRVFSWRNVTG